jgi:hypothetical protein
VSEWARKENVRTTVLAAAIIAGINLVSLVLDQRDHAFPALLAVDLVHALIALTIILMLVRGRTTWSSRACDIAFIIATTPFTVGMWLPQTHDVQGGELLEPMLNHHFLLLGIAVVAPSWRSGSAMIVVFTGHAIALWQWLVAAGTSSPALDREPWFSLFFGACAAMLLFTRERRRRLEQRLATAEARAQMLARVSRILLALRDRANTPLQTLEVALAMLEQGHDSPATLPMMRRALERLVTVQRALAVTQPAADDLVPQDLEGSLRQLLEHGDLESEMHSE